MRCCVILVYCSMFVKLFVLHITDCSTSEAVHDDQDVIDFKVEPVEVSDCI